jgi:hypothetical protein
MKKSKTLSLSGLTRIGESKLIASRKMGENDSAYIIWRDLLVLVKEKFAFTTLPPVGGFVDKDAKTAIHEVFPGYRPGKLDSADTAMILRIKYSKLRSIKKCENQIEYFINKIPVKTRDEVIHIGFLVE